MSDHGFQPLEELHSFGDVVERHAHRHDHQVRATGADADDLIQNAGKVDDDDAILASAVKLLRQGDFTDCCFDCDQRRLVAGGLAPSHPLQRGRLRIRVEDRHRHPNAGECVRQQ